MTWRRWRLAIPVLALIGLAILWATFVTLQDDWTLPDYAPGKILSLFSGTAALFAGFAAAQDEDRPAALLDWLLLINAGLLAAGLVLLWIGPAWAGEVFWLEREGRFQGLVGNANVTAAVSAVFAIIAFQRLLTARPPAWAPRFRHVRLIYMLFLFEFCAVVGLTASRFTSFVLIVLMLPFAVVIARRWKGPAYLRLIAIGTTAVMAVGLFLLSSLLRSRVGQLSIGLRERRAIWSHMADVAGDAPFSGYGLGSFSTIHAHFMTTPRFAQATWTINSPHDLVLQLLLQAGWPYLLLLTAAAGVVIWQRVRLAAHAPTEDDYLLAAAVTLMVGCAMVDVVLDMPCSVTLMLVCAGLLWGSGIERAKAGVAVA